MINYELWLNKFVYKTSGKPFKSGDKLGKPVKIIEHPQLHIPAFVMKDDGSYVECRRCELLIGGEYE